MLRSTVLASTRGCRASKLRGRLRMAPVYHIIIYVIHVFVRLLVPKHVPPALLNTHTPSLSPPSLSQACTIIKCKKQSQKFTVQRSRKLWNVTALWTVTKSWTTAKVTNDQKTLKVPPQNYEPPQKLWTTTKIMSHHRNYEPIQKQFCCGSYESRKKEPFLKRLNKEENPNSFSTTESAKY